jgi:hypothetical protein
MRHRADGGIAPSKLTHPARAPTLRQNDWQRAVLGLTEAQILTHLFAYRCRWISIGTFKLNELAIPCYRLASPRARPSVARFAELSPTTPASLYPLTSGGLRQQRGNLVEAPLVIFPESVRNRVVQAH